MMRQMREHTKWVILLVAIAFVGLMVFEWGMDISGRSAQASGGIIGEVNGEPIGYDEFYRTYRELYQQQQDAQNEPLSATQNRQIEDQAWEQVLGERLVAQEIRRRGLGATEAEVRQAARYAPPPELYDNELFQTNGQFDITKYHQFLASPSVDPQMLLQLEGYYRDVIPRSKLMQQVTSGIYLPDSELWRLWQERTETARVQLVELDVDQLVPDNAVSVSDREIRTYYDAHEEEFELPARAAVRFVALEKRATAADTSLALARAQELRQQILGGQEFAEVAGRESADPGSARQGGSLGTFTRGQMVPPFDSAAFSLPIGQVSEPVKTSFGFHIIQVQSREGDTATGRHILVPIRDGAAMADQLADRADSLETVGERQGLEAAARQFGLSIRRGQITEEEPFLPGIGDVGDASEWALREAAPGETSELFENAAAYYMVQLDEMSPAGVVPLPTATPAIRAKLMRQKKLERAKLIGREIVDRVRAGATLQQAALARDLRVQEAGPFTRLDFVPALGRGNAAVGAAFGLDRGETSGVIEADGRLFILHLLEKTQAERARFDEQKPMLRYQTMQAMEQARWNDFLFALRQRAEISDFRDEVLRGTGDTTTAPPRPPIF